MARVTAEDCIIQIPNCFELVLVAATQAKRLAKGLTPLVSRDKDKNPVVALREIALGPDFAEEFKNNAIRALQKNYYDASLEADRDEPEAELEDEKDWSAQIAQLSRELESLGSIEEDFENEEDSFKEDTAEAEESDADDAKIDFIEEEDDR